MISELFKQVEKWGDARGITYSANRKSQALKVVEEIGELCDGIHKNDMDEIIDGIGDSMVTLILLSKQYNYDLIEIIDDIELTNPKLIYENILMWMPSYIGQLARNVLKEKNEGVIISIKNIILTLYDLAHYYGTTIEECLESAWNVIKDREGETVDGTFIKKE